MVPKSIYDMVQKSKKIRALAQQDRALAEATLEFGLADEVMAVGCLLGAIFC